MILYRCFWEGLRRLSGRWQLLAFSYLANLLSAAFLFLPVMDSLQQHVVFSQVSDRLLRDMDLLWLEDFVFHLGREAWEQFAGYFLVAALLFALLHLFLVGGTIQAFLAKGPFTWEGFFSGCGRYGYRMFRLGLLSVPIYLTPVLVFLSLSRVQEALLPDSPSEPAAFYTGFARWTLTVLLLLFVNMFLDYAKIHVVRRESQRVTQSMHAALRWLAGHLKPALGLFYLNLLLGLVCLLAYFGLASRLVVDGAGGILAALVLQQLYMLSRVGVRLLFYSSQLSLFDSLSGSNSHV
ncbi:MAG: hypothetical protein HY652_02570 [Acidobacteria bacterium]|nr:hypothetical protein [Acidobacteriota bacterium]